MPYTITPLLTGLRTLDQGNMTYGQRYGKTIWLPIWIFLLRGEEKNILIDTGLDEDEVMPNAEFTAETGLEPKTITECLAGHGLAPEDIDVVINTHLHNDHCGNNPLFTNAAFYAQRSDWEFCKNPHPLDYRYDEDYIEGQEFTLLDGDAEILPGIRAVHVPGHTPGSMALFVDTQTGPAAITGFCCNAKNFPAAGPAVCPGVHLDAAAAYDSIQRFKLLAEESKARIIPMHELELTDRC